MVSEKLKSILVNFLGHFVPSDIGPLTNHPLISCPTHEMNIVWYEGCRFCGVELGLKPISNRLRKKEIHLNCSRSKHVKLLDIP